jgi:hypothetical protein
VHSISALKERVRAGVALRTPTGSTRVRKRPSAPRKSLAASCFFAMDSVRATRLYFSAGERNPRMFQGTTMES